MYRLVDRGMEVTRKDRDRHRRVGLQIILTTRGFSTVRQNLDTRLWDNVYLLNTPTVYFQG